MVKLLALDLDKTLIRDNNTISDTDKKAIQKCIDRGIIVSIISGRNDASIKPIAQELKIIKNKHIGVNGALLLDFINGHEELVTIDNDIYDYLVEKFSEDNRDFMPLNREGYFYKNEGHLLDDVRTWIDDEGLIKGDLASLKDCYRISVHFDDKEDLEYLKSYLPKSIYGTVDRNVYDIRPTKVNKFTGLEALMKHYDINKNEVATIGDQASDIELLENTKYSFAVQNADEFTKKSANYVLKKTNNENAVAEMINEYLLK